MVGLVCWVDALNSEINLVTTFVTSYQKPLVMLSCTAVDDGMHQYTTAI
jgi:hypothetical protein